MRFPEWMYENAAPNAWGERFLKLRWMVFMGVVALVLFISVIFAGVESLEMVSCHKAASKVGVTGHYSVWNQCYYKLPNGKMVPQENYPPKYIKVER